MTLSPEEREKLLSRPAALPPHGKTADFNHSSQFEKSGFVVAVVLLVLIALLFLIRIFVKARIDRHVALEDYLLALAWILYSGGYTVVAILVTRKHVGAHIRNLTVGQLIDYLKTFHAGSVLYNVIMLPLKISLTLQVLRFFVPAGTRNFTFWMSHVLIWLNLVFYITCTFLLIFACKPEAKLYDPTVTGGHCLDTAAILISTAVLNAVSDALMLVLPQRVIWELAMPMKRKLGLSAAFFVALLAFGSSIVRLYFATQLKLSNDATYNIGWLGLWTLPEIAIGFFIACCPYLPKFAKYMLHKSTVSNLLKRGSVKVRSSPVKNRHSRNSREYMGISRFRRSHHPTRMISDVEFDELVARTGISSIDVRLEVENPKHAMINYQSDWHNGEQLDSSRWPPGEENAHEAAVWTGKDGSQQPSQVPEPGAITVTSDVSVSRE